MSQTETKVMPVQQQTPSLDLTELRTVKWIQSVGAVKQTYKFTEDKYRTTKRIPIFYWILASIEMVFISIFLFIHSLPWPNFILEIIYKIDRFIEKSLEAIANKIEWWWDIFVVRFMWFRDSLESLVDAILSFGLFLVYKIVDIWMWTISLAIRVLEFVFSPLIRIVKAILPPHEKMSKPTTSENSGAQASANDSSSVASDFLTKKKETEPETEDQERYSGSTSECESDVSVVSESWSIGHTDKFGKYYNRVEMKATAEGRLRAAMYKRVKSQLSLMRKNSVRFSRGMTAYVKQLLEPKVVPIFITLKIWLRDLAAKYGLADTYDRIWEWGEKHYIVSLLVYFVYSAAMVPVNIVNKVLRRKKKSRRTRSMRSESLRRRAAAGNATSNLEPYGLIKSKEPVVVEEPEYCNLRRLQKTTSKDDDDSMRDSALASSIDDLHTSDSNDGPNYVKEQTIVEEEPKDLWNERVNECIIKNKKNEETNLENVPKVTVTEPKIGETETLHDLSQETQSKNGGPNTISVSAQKSSRGKNAGNEKAHSQSKERRHSEGLVSSPELNNKGVRKDISSSQKLNQRTKNGQYQASSPLTKRSDRIHGTYADVTKSEENLRSIEEGDNDSNGAKTSKRKISFSIDSVKNNE